MMVHGPPRLRELPLPARGLVGVTAVLSVLVAVTAVVSGDAPVSPWPVLALSAGIAVSEGLRVDLPFRRAGTAQFNLSDAALTVGLLLLPPAEVVLAACLGKLCWQLVDRVPSLKLVFNLAWYVTGTGVAALVVGAIAPRPGPVAAGSMIAVGMGLCTLTAVNATAVSGIIALSARQSWPATARRIVPTLALLTVTNAGLGLIAVLLAETRPWALVALAIPVALLYGASRAQVHATVDRERSAAVVTVEHRLSDATDPAAVASALVEGVGEVLGLRAAIWRDGRWLTPPPAPPGAGLPGSGTQQAPLGRGEGVLVAWPGELGVTVDSAEWLARLARSGGVHLDRAAAHSALEQERATLRAVVDGTGDGIFVVDESATLRLWNPAMGRLAARLPEQALGLPVSTVLGPGPWQTPGVHDVTRPGVNPHTWRVSVATVRDTAHSSLHVAVVHDVTAERRVARMKDDMLAVVSHELRTPLTPIKASAQLLRLRGNAMREEQREELLAQIEGRADHLTRLVEDLLLVGQLSSARTRPATPTAPSGARPPVTAAHVDLAGLLREEVAQLALARPGHTLFCIAPDEELAVVDPRRVRQIVDNLVENACKFSPTATTVRITLSTNEHTATLVVADEGRGIAPDDLDRILEPFQRGEDPLHMTTSGAGLGLFIVRELVGGLGGRLHIASEVGVGTAVTVTLPLIRPAARPATAAAGGPLSLS
ncbi:MAG TPA: ATP-binding protein [Egibacteraceae bacterium]|nr:ATP-binding protein [Egibacteraceae bacterium]